MQKSSLLSSLVLPNIRLPFNPTLRVLSYNIRTQFLSLNCLTLALHQTYSLPILNQRSAQTFSQEDHCWTLDIRGIPTNRGNTSHLFAPKLTGVFQTYHLLWMYYIHLSPISLVLQAHLWFVYTEEQQLVLKTVV